MSRIDEALRAVEREAAAAAGITPPAAAPRALRRATLEHYPQEGAAARRAAVEDVPAAAPPLPAAPLALPRNDNGIGTAESRGKLVGPETPAVLLEQYRRVAAALHDAQ